MNEKVKEIFEWIYCIIIALVLALLFRYFIGTPTIVQQRSMFPTLKENQRLLLNRTFRITGVELKRGDIVTFEAPTKKFTEIDVDQTNPVAVYHREEMNLFEKFLFYSLEITKTSYIKRVIGIPGDHIKIENNTVYVNGVAQDETYLADDVVTSSNVFNDFIVPEGQFFAMGDNRTKSVDCREIGCIPFDKLEGIVFFRFWPLNVIGKMD